MFFFLPVGHDRSIGDFPWATTALIVLCVLVHIWVDTTSPAADERLIDSLDQLYFAVIDHGDGHVDKEMLAAIPEPMRADFDYLSEVPAGGEADGPLYDAALDAYQASTSHPVLKYGYRSDRLKWWAPLTSQFVHGDWFHLIGNMLFLWLVGSVIEGFWGVGWFLALYLVGGAAAAFAEDAFTGDLYVLLVGASGAIAAAMGAFMVGFPRTRIRMAYFFWVYVYVRRGTVLVPAWAALGLWFAWNLWDALSASGGGVAYWAHAGGFAVGALSALAMARWGPIVVLE